MYATVMRRCFATDGIGLVSKDPETCIWQAVDMNDRSVLFRPCRGGPVATELPPVSHEVPLDDAVVWRHVTMKCVICWQMMTMKKQASTRVPMRTLAKQLRRKRSHRD